MGFVQQGNTNITANNFFPWELVGFTYHDFLSQKVLAYMAGATDGWGSTPMTEKTLGTVSVLADRSWSSPFINIQ